MAERKPLAIAGPQSREPHSIRFTENEWLAICDGARSRGLEPAVFTRMLALYGLSIAQAPTLPEASAWNPGELTQVLAGAQRITRRF